MSDFRPGAIAPETLLRQAFAEEPHLADVAATLPPIPVPYGRLATIPGWAVWLGHPPAPMDLNLLPLPEEIIWGDPDQALAAAALVSADYAARRGAENRIDAREIIERESPVAIIVPGEVYRSVDPWLATIAGFGVPVVRMGAGELIADTPGFAARTAAHAVDLGRRHDPVLAFDEIASVDGTGGNPLSSFIVHNEPEADGVRVIGDPSERVGIEIGIAGDNIDVAATATIERVAIDIPSFLEGVTSYWEGHSLRIEWAAGLQPSGEMLGGAFSAWLKALCCVDVVDVRIVYAPTHGRSAVLTDMRARAKLYRSYRDAVIAGHPNPASMLQVDDGQSF